MIIVISRTRIYQSRINYSQISGDQPLPTVVWSQNFAATTGNYHFENTASQAVIDEMFEDGILALTGASSVAEAWQYLLPCGDSCEGATIAIKLNFNNNFVYDGWPMTCDTGGCPLVQTTLALTKQLVNEAGFPQESLWFYDTTRDIDSYLPAAFSTAEFGNVAFNPFAKSGNANYEVPSMSDGIFSSELVQADYLINMPLVRNHGMAGFTLSFKNHVGSIACTTPGDFDCVRSIHGTFYINNSTNPLLEINNHELIKDKTILIIGDGIFATTYGGPDGFPNLRGNSLFFSRDPVAIDSVMADFLQFNNANLDHSGNSRIILALAANSGLGNYATSCPMFPASGNSCDFSYSNINLIECDASGCPDSDPVTYTVNFNSNTGDTEAVPQSILAEYNSTVVLPSPPTKIGNSFIGWNTQADGQGLVFTEETPVVNNITVYAQWMTNSYSLLYRDYDDSVIQNTSYLFGADLSVHLLPDNPVRDGYIFTGWSIDLPSTMPPNNLNIIAQYEPMTFTLSYAAGDNGSLLGNLSQTVEFGQNGSEVTAVANEGYEFSHWSDSSVDNPRTDTNVESNLAVTALFSSLGEPTLTPSPSPTSSPPTPTPTHTPDPTNTPTPTATITPIPPTATPTNVPTSTPTSAPTATPQPTSTPTSAPTATPHPTSTPTASPTSTPRPTSVPATTPISTLSPTVRPTSEPSARDDSSGDDDAAELRLFELTYVSRTNEIQVNWRTNIEADAKVEYGEQEDLLNRLVARNIKQRTHSLMLTNLVPGTGYFFRVSSTASPDNSHTTKVYYVKTKQIEQAIDSETLLEQVATTLDSDASTEEITQELDGDHDSLELLEKHDISHSAGRYQTTIFQQDGVRRLSRVKFLIVDEKNEPIPSLAVTIFSEPQTRYTNDQGIVEFENVEAGPHTLSYHFNDRSHKHKVEVDIPDTDADTLYLDVIKINPEEKRIQWQIMLVITAVAVVLLTALIVKNRITT